jgi:hypothetical protein
MQKFPKLKTDMRVIKQSITSFIAMDICFQIVKSQDVENEHNIKGGT